MEFSEANFAYKKLIEPSVDQELAKKVLDKNWLPDPNVHLFSGGETSVPSSTTEPPK
jgi:hypothetical protein